MSKNDHSNSTNYGQSTLEPSPQFIKFTSPPSSVANNNNSNTATSAQPEQSTPSAFWRNPVYPPPTTAPTTSNPSNNNNNKNSPIPRLRQIQPTSPPNSDKEDLFKRSEATMYPPGYPPLNRPPTMEQAPHHHQHNHGHHQPVAPPHPSQQIPRAGASTSTAPPPPPATTQGGRRTRITRAYVMWMLFSLVQLAGNTIGNALLTIYIESLETRLKKMEKLLEQMQSGGEEGSSGKKRKRSSDEGDSVSTGPSDNQSQQESLSPAPANTLATTIIPGCSSNSTVNNNNINNSKNSEVDGADKVMRYHGSSSGYYLMRNVIPSAHGHNTSIIAASQPLDEDGERSQITENGPTGFKKVDVFDDDIVLVRDSDDTTRETTEHSEEVVPRKVIETLVHCYFDMPNTTLPILNKEEYLDAFEERKTPPPPTLLTYAICSYACFLINSDNPVFKGAGMNSEQVFHTLVERAAQLIRRDYLIPRISTIKALVILCSLPTYSTSSYRNWILAGMAVRMAQDVGLHRTVKTDQMSKENVEARKRLWYSVYVTDRWCCAVMGRPLAISDSDCDVDLPDMKGVNGEDYDIFVNFVKLSSILGELLRRIYSPKAKAAGYRGTAMEQTMAHFQRMLTEWFGQLPDDCRISEEDLVAIKNNPEKFAGTKKLDQGGPLTICYHSVTVLLNRPFILLENETSGEGETNYADASRRCMEAAKLVIDIARLVPSTSTSRFGWNFAVYSVFQATLIHVYNCTSNKRDVAKTSQQYAHISMEECLPAVMKDIPYKPPIIPFIEKLIALLGADSSNQKDNEDKRTGPAVTDESQHPAPNASPMSLQQMISADPNVPSASADTTQSTTGNNASDQWTYPSTTQATWQQLFSSAGAPFTADSSTGLDLQGIVVVLLVELIGTILDAHKMTNKQRNNDYLGILFGNQQPNNDANFFMQ
ncbi:hypothetical protein INT45_008935 [Circinella minor]|uniref:Xylanolytic transcriptional activator regulatory domain-containing protein n=1 Tax=Circinella minor TaxID=1195481 RepID=A0A8H7VLA4_9FUNG|nr:hypothetical protein INT45_008935 [Circinella minor]